MKYLLISTFTVLFLFFGFTTINVSQAASTGATGFTIISAPDKVSEGTLMKFAPKIPKGYYSSYSWNLGDGSPNIIGMKAMTIHHIYAQSGTYDVTITVPGSSGSTVLAKKTIVVQDAPSVSGELKMTITSTNIKTREAITKILAGKMKILLAIQKEKDKIPKMDAEIKALEVKMEQAKTRAETATLLAQIDAIKAKKAKIPQTIEKYNLKMIKLDQKFATLPKY